MKSNLEPSTQEVLSGLVERVTFHNAENGFCVFRAKARGHRDLVTVVGHAATIFAGEWITASGESINDRGPRSAVQGAVSQDLGAKCGPSCCRFWIGMSKSDLIVNRQEPLLLLG
jgi:hypothetical protein